MEQNISLKEKLMNTLANLGQMMSSDRRVFFSIIGVGILVVVFIIIAVMSFSRSQSETTLTSQTPSVSTPTSRRVSSTVKQKIPATISLVLTNPKKAYKVNDLITFTIVGDTGGQQIRGYDAVFKFDPARVSFVSEKNLYPSFNYRRRIRNNWMIVTATQPLSSAKKSTFSKTPLMGMTFKALKPGAAYFPISYIPDSFSDSNLIDTKSNDMLLVVILTILVVILTMVVGMDNTCNSI